MPEPTATDRHLKMLDELAEIGMVLARRLIDLPPLSGQDTSLDFDRVTRAVRRSILLYHLLKEGRLPHPKAAPERNPERNPEQKPESTPTPTAAGTPRLRPERLDALDDVSAPFEHVVAAIVQDIQAALATAHLSPAQTALVQPIIRRQLPLPTRHEADQADVE